MTIGINHTVSPIKLCFLIELNSEFKFEQTVKIAFSYGGGIFNQIFQIHSLLPDEYKNKKLCKFFLGRDKNCRFK